MPMNFDGANDGADIGSPAGLDNIFAGGGTIMGWIRAEGFGGSGFGRVFDKSSNNVSAGGWALFVDGGAESSFHFAHDFSTTLGRWLTPVNSVVLNTWIHVVVAYDNSSAANDPAIYIDGVLQTLIETTPVGTADSDAAEDLMLANLEGSPRAFNGQMADMRIYDRVLDAVEVEIIFNGQGVDGILDGILAWWPMADDRPDVAGQDSYSHGQTNTTGASLTLSVDVPPETEDGDPLLLVLASSGDSSGTPEDITTPAGWTAVNPGQTDLPATFSTPSVWIFERAASSEPASYVVTGNQTTTKLGVILNRKTTNVSAFDVSSNINTGTTATPIAPSISPSANAMVFWICVMDDNDMTPDLLANFPDDTNGRKSAEATGTGNGVSMLIATELVDSGATGTRSFSFGGSTEQWGCVSVAYLFGQGATNENLKDYSDNAWPSRYISGPTFTEESPDLKERRAA